MTILGIVVRVYGMDVYLYGKILPQHVSDLMTEHEAIKSLNIFSIIIIVVCFLSALLSYARIDHTKIELYFKYPVSNFILTLAAVSLAISISVFISTLGIPEAFLLIIGVAINAVLSLSLFSSIHFFNKREVTAKNISIGVLSGLTFIGVLFRGSVIGS